MTLASWLRTQPALAGCTLFETSGSTGPPKHVVLSPAALQASARMVNAHLHSTSTDVWLGALPRHHVGGHSLKTRADLSGASLIWLDGKWNASAFCQLAKEHQATLTSLVPTQVYDLVDQQCPCPPSFRAVLVGGGALSFSLSSQAHELGWPLLATYGMTETASQVATQSLDSEPSAPMRVLPGWETRVTDELFLQLRGPALFSGYVSLENGGYEFAPHNDWFTTSDQVELSAGTLRFLARDADRLKIKGELVNLSNLRAALSRAAELCGLSPHLTTLLAYPDSRNDHALILVVETSLSETQRTALRQAYEEATLKLVHPKTIITVDAIPRTTLGKIAESALRHAVDRLTRTDCPS